MHFVFIHVFHILSEIYPLQENQRKTPWIFRTGNTVSVSGKAAKSIIIYSIIILHKTLFGNLYFLFSPPASKTKTPKTAVQRTAVPLFHVYIISQKLSVPVKYDMDFREVNNGDLAGLDNRIAEEKYPNLYWRKLDWEEHYPNGESTKEFYERISNAWNNLKKSQKNSRIDSCCFCLL